MMIEETTMQVEQTVQARVISDDINPVLRVVPRNNGLVRVEVFKRNVSVQEVLLEGENSDKIQVRLLLYVSDIQQVLDAAKGVAAC